MRAAFRHDPQQPGRRLPRIIETNVFGRCDPSPSGRLIDVALPVSHFCVERPRLAENSDGAFRCTMPHTISRRLY
jgi:hypothetical protein